MSEKSAHIGDLGEVGAACLMEVGPGAELKGIALDAHAQTLGKPERIFICRWQRIDTLCLHEHLVAIVQFWSKAQQQEVVEIRALTRFAHPPRKDRQVFRQAGKLYTGFGENAATENLHHGHGGKSL